MADNLTYGATGGGVPVGTVQKTDDLGASGHVPYVKLMDGTANSLTVIIGANGGLGVGGNVAHDASDTGYPAKIGGKAASAEPAAVANGDRVNAQFDLTGRQVIMPYAIPEQTEQAVVYSTSGSGELFASGGAGIKHHVTAIQFWCPATGNDVVTIYATSEIGVVPFKAPGEVATFPIPIVGNAGKPITFGNTSSTQIFISAQGYKGR